MSTDANVAETNAVDVKDVVEDGKNSNPLKCQRCPSRILNPGVGIYQHIEFQLPHMKKKNDTAELNEEPIEDYWLVEDMYLFENVGFSNTVGTVKYLTCADCEIGPIGWFDMSTKKSYVALSRVRHIFQCRKDVIDTRL